MNPLSTTEKKPSPAGAVCPHCNTPIKFSAFGSFRKTYTCPACQNTFQAKIGLLGFAAILVVPPTMVAMATDTTTQAMRLLGICPASLGPISTVLAITTVVAASLLLSAWLIAPLLHRTRTLCRPS